MPPAVRSLCGIIWNSASRLTGGFYRDMKNYLRSLGVKVPIVASNPFGGAADVYGHTDGDFMENNSYFNHPLLPFQDTTFHSGRPDGVCFRQSADYADWHRLL